MTSKALLPVLAAVALAVAGCDAGENLGVPDEKALLLAEAVSMNSVRLRWFRPDIQGLRSYRIERRANLAGAFAELAVIPAGAGDTALYFDTTAEPDQIYGYRMSALGNAGATTGYSVVAGARTPPRPGIDVRVSTEAPNATTASDPDGYVIRIHGPSDTSGAVGVADGGVPLTRRFSPLAPGDYSVVLSGVAENCRVPKEGDETVAADTTREVSVTDLGINTISRVSFDVVCRDPNRGTIEANVTVSGIATNGGKFQVVASGVADDATLPEEERAYAQTREVEESGGPALFDGVRPGAYEIRLRDVGAGCALSGDSVRAVTLAKLEIQRLEFIVECGGSGGGDVDDPARPFKLRNEWSSAAPAAGSIVALDVSLTLTDTPPFVFASADVLTAFSSTVLRPDSVVAGPGFSVNETRGTPGVVGWTLINSTPAPATGSIQLVRIWFTVIGPAGATTRTATTIREIGDENGDVGDGTATYASRTQPFPEARLTVGGGGGGENLPPVASISGADPLTATAGAVVTFSADGSSDPDGTVASYAWSFPGGNPAGATGAQVSTTYAAAGSYDATLTVTDDDGATATATRSVTVTGGAGGSNQPPVAVIAGANPLPAIAGAAVTLSAAGSSDPEGGPLTYGWSLPGGSPSSGTGPTVSTTYSAAGSATATLTVTDDQGATASATRTITVSPSGSSGTPVTWKNSFGSTGPDGAVAMTITLDLRTNLTDTPGPEQLQSFRADAITWDPAILTYDRTQFPASISGTPVFDPAQPSRLKVQGQTVGDGPTGLVALATVHFKRKAGASGTTSTVTTLGKVLGSPATLNYNYLPKTAVVEGSYSASGGGTPPTGIVTGTLTRAGTGTQSLAGISVTVDPSASGAPNATGIVSGSGGSATFSLNVQVGSGTGAGAGSVTLALLPSGCSVTSPSGGTGSYTGLASGGTKSVPFTVTCTGSTPGPGTGTVSGTLTRSGAGTQSLAGISVTVDPSASGAPNATASVTGSGASVTFSVAVQIGTGTGAGAGSVVLGSLPSGCTVSAPSGGSASYTGLTAGGSKAVAFTVTCAGSAPANKYRHKSTWGMPSGGSVELTITFDPSGFNNPAPELNGSAADAFGGVQTVTTITGTNVGRLTAVSAVATPSFGSATMGGTLPIVSWASNTTVLGGFTGVQEVARFRFTIGGSGAASLNTSSDVREISTPNGDAFNLIFSGSGQNIEVIEAGALALP